MKLHQALEVLTVNDLKNLRDLTPGAVRSQRKGDLVAAVSHYLLQGDLGLVWEFLSELELKAIAETVHSWGGVFDAARFRARYGAVPPHFTRDPYLSLYSFGKPRAPERRDVLPLFFYQGEIPEDLRPRLAALVPPPPELPFTTLAAEELPATLPGAAPDAPPEPLRRVATETLVAHDLLAVLRLVGQGSVAVGPKTGLPSSAAVARIEAVLLGGDWYAPEDDAQAERWEGGSIRPIRSFAWALLLQTGGLAKVDGSRLVLTPRGNKALSQPLAEVVATLFARWKEKGTPDELKRVDVIKGQTAKGVKLTPPAQRRGVINEALRECPVGRWIAVDELFRQMQVRDHSFPVSHNTWALYIADPNYGSLGYNGCGGFEILQARYCLAYLFEYLATLGLIDVAYTRPYGARPDYGDAWGTDSLLFLSRYDGLRYLRINPLGAYCLGLAPEYRPTREAKPTLCTLEGDLGLHLLRDPEPAERLMLERIALSRSGQRWDLDPEALLPLSAASDEQGRIRDFLTSALGGDLPEPLRGLLDSLAERATALTDAGPARLIQCRDPALAAHLAADPATAPHCRHAGASLLCVPESKLKAFRKGVTRLGLVLPEMPHD
jgi:hypothetical protein